MTKKIIFIALAGLFAIPALCQHPYQDNNWDVIFTDSFSTFNTGLWYKADNHVHGAYNYYDSDQRGEEPQVYTQDNAYIENGKLVLRTKVQTYPCPKGAGFLNCQYGGIHNYTSGQIVSNTTYKYGYYEIYAKLPASSGYWPAFWFWNNTPDTQTSNCWYNEIDVFEAYGDKPNAVESRAHWHIGCPLNFDSVVNIENIPHPCNYSTGYHWYGLEWDRNKITWYIDRNPVRQIANDMEGIGIQNPMYIILNVALYPPTWEGNQILSSTIFPNYMYIDQVNAWSLKCDPNAIVNEITNYNTFNYAVKKSISLSSMSSLSSGQNISLRATDFIELKGGFEVPLGAELFLDINACE
ncbi:MAG: glycoside hydrolase family 16 protein [Bacteroidales bacterium]